MSIVIQPCSTVFGRIVTVKGGQRVGAPMPVPVDRQLTASKRPVHVGTKRECLFETANLTCAYFLTSWFKKWIVLWRHEQVSVLRRYFPKCCVRLFWFWAVRRRCFAKVSWTMQFAKGFLVVKRIYFWGNFIPTT